MCVHHQENFSVFSHQTIEGIHTFSISQLKVSNHLTFLHWVIYSWMNKEYMLKKYYAWADDRWHQMLCARFDLLCLLCTWKSSLSVAVTDWWTCVNSFLAIRCSETTYRSVNWSLFFQLQYNSSIISVSFQSHLKFLHRIQSSLAKTLELQGGQFVMTFTDISVYMFLN